MQVTLCVLLPLSHREREPIALNLYLHHRVHPILWHHHGDILHRHARREVDILQLLQRPGVNVLPANTAQHKVDLRAAGQHILHNHRPAGLHQPQRALQESHRIGIVEVLKYTQRVDQFGLMLAQLQQ